MIKKIIIVLIVILFTSCSSDYPKQFSEKALQDMVITKDGAKMTFGEILYKNKGKTILIDVWASWCKDCIVGFPSLKQIQKKFPEVSYVYLSVDRGTNAWKRAIEKYQLKGEHYNLPKGQNNGDFVEFINLWWIPRYLVINKKGQITVFKATKITDKDILQALKEDS